jgi:hypothetical protein
MGLPDQEPTAADALAWLDRDAGMQVFNIANSWYTRTRWRQPYRRHDSLMDAICFAMTNHRMLREAAVMRGGR